MQQIPVKHKPLTFYLRTLLYMFIALFLRVLTFAPLAFLFAFPAGSPARYLALLCPVLFLFFLLPLRYSFADALVQKPRERWFSFDRALSMSDYGEKLVESLLHALNVLKWGIPLFVMLGGCYYFYMQTDVKTLLEALINTGKGVTDVWCAVANFFIRLFGSVHTLTSNGGLMEGLYVLLAVLGVGALIWLYGALRNSASRYIWALANREERSTRSEIRRRLRGRRWRQLGVGLINLVLWVPALIVVFSTFKGILSEMSTQLMLSLAQAKLPALELTKTAGPLLFAFVCLYMPLLPVRRYLTAAFATRRSRHAVPRQSVEGAQRSTPAAPAAAPITAAPAAAPAAQTPFSSESDQRGNIAPQRVEVPQTPVFLDEERVPQWTATPAPGFAAMEPSSERAAHNPSAAEPSSPIAATDGLFAAPVDPTAALDNRNAAPAGSDNATADFSGASATDSAAAPSAANDSNDFSTFTIGQ